MKNKYFWSIVIIGSLTAAVFLESNEPNQSIAALLGAATALVIIPAIISLTISGLMRLAKKKMEDGEYNNMFLFIWGIVIAFFLLGFILE